MGDFRFPSWHNDKIDEIWSEILDHVCARQGPFAKLEDSQKLPELKKLASAIYPQGIPRLGEVPLDEYLQPGGILLKFLTDIYRNVTPLPLKSRWHSLERTSWHLLLLYRTGFLQYCIQSVHSVTFWPGDNVKLEEITSDEYRKRSVKRLTRVRDFVASRDFEKQLVNLVSAHPIESSYPNGFRYLPDGFLWWILVGGRRVGRFYRMVT